MASRDLDRRRLLQGSLALGGLGLAGCATQPRMGAPRLDRAWRGGRATVSAAGARPSRPPVRHHGLPAPVPRPGPAHRGRADRRHLGGAQLRPWRQRLVAVLGLGQSGDPESAGEQSRADRGDRLRRHRPHLRHHGAAGRRAGHHLCPRSLAPDPLGARHRQLDAGLAHRAEGRRRPRISAISGNRWRASPSRPIANIWACPARRWNSPTATPCPTSRSSRLREAAEKLDTLGFATYSDRIRDLTPRGDRICRKAPRRFPVKYVRRSRIDAVQHRRLRATR